MKTRHSRKCFQERRQKSAISEYLAALYMFTSLRKRGQSWTLPDEREYFFGYSDKSKAYRIYILGHRKVEINRDVTFDENVAFSKSK
jgi:hypothetical protein